MNRKPAPRAVQLTWGAELPETDSAAPSTSQRRAPLKREALGYALSLGAVTAAILLTRLTWPLFSRTPFVLLLAANFAAARFGNETGALLAIIVSAFAAGLAMPGDAANVDQIAIAVMVSGSLLINRIVIGRNRVERALRESEAQFRAAWDNSTFGAALLNRKGLVERINPAMERTLGYPGAAWTGVSFGYFSHPDDQAEERARFAAFMDGAEEWYHREQRYRRADGGIIWCRVTMSATHDGEGGPLTGALMVLEDVSRRRRAEEDLRRWEARYHRLFEQLPIGLFQCGSDGRLRALNAACLRLIGCASADDLRTTGLADLVAERSVRSEIQDLLAAGGRVLERMVVLARKDGGRVSVILDVRPVRTAEGVVEYLDGSIREV